MEKCEHCRDPFTAERSTARFCSPRCRVAAHRAKARPAVAKETPLKETAKQQIAREKSKLEREYQRKHKALQESFYQSVIERFNQWRKTELANVVEKEADLDEREKILRLREQDVSAFMTKKEFDLVRSCLHSDHPTRDKARLDKASAIFNRLGVVANRQHGKVELRRRGWAK